MKKNIETLKLVAFVLGSSRRKIILEKLHDNLATPSALSRMCSLQRSNLSNALRELVAKDLAICLNPESYKGRIYCLTDLGEEIYEHLDDVKL